MIMQMLQIKTKLEALNTASMKLEMMYKQNPQSQGQKVIKKLLLKRDLENEAKDENIVDADFEEVDEDTEKKVVNFTHLQL